MQNSSNRKRSGACGGCYGVCTCVSSTPLAVLVPGVCICLSSPLTSLSVSLPLNFVMWKSAGLCRWDQRQTHSKVSLWGASTQAATFYSRSVHSHLVIILNPFMMWGKLCFHAIHQHWISLSYYFRRGLILLSYVLLYYVAVTLQWGTRDMHALYLWTFPLTANSPLN